MLNILKDISLFKDMTQDDINKCLTCSGAKVKNYKSKEIIFHQKDIPKYLYILLSGSVSLNRDLHSGEQTLITIIEKPGTIFGETYVFLPSKSYDLYATIIKDSSVLAIPKEFFYVSCSNTCNHHQQLTKNMLSVLADKTYYMNQKVQILLSGQLNSKIAYYLYLKVNEFNSLEIRLPSRKDMAKYLGVARPSLSRELMNMQKEGILSINGNQCKILDIDKLEYLL